MTKIRYIDNNVKYKVMYNLDFKSCYYFSLTNKNNYKDFKKIKEEKQIENTHKNKKELNKVIKLLITNIKIYAHFYYVYYYHYQKSFFKKKDVATRIIKYYYNQFKNNKL